MIKDCKREIEELELMWKRFRETPFPTDMGGCDVLDTIVTRKEVSLAESTEISLALLDTEAAGCITTFLSRKNLDAWRISILGQCYRDLAVVRLTHDHPLHVAYLTDLERISGKVLKLVTAINKK